MLAQALVDRATGRLYKLLLDTLDDREAARGLYTSLGFEEVLPYCFNPIVGAHYLKLSWTSRARLATEDDPSTEPYIRHGESTELTGSFHCALQVLVAAWRTLLARHCQP